MKKLLFIAAAISLMAVPAFADVLWDQYAPSFADGAYNDFDAGCFGFQAADAAQANDVSFTESVTINSVTTVYDYYNSDGQDLIELTTEAYLMIVPMDGNLVFPENDPHNYPLVPVTVTIVNIDGTDCQELTAPDLDIMLEAGDYWVSLLPIAMAPSGFSNQHYVATTQVGESFRYGTFCAGGPWYTAADFGLPDLDTTLLIEGTTGSVASEGSALGAVKALYR